MSNKYGDILYQRTSWGSKQLYAQFGFNGLNKAVANSDEAGEQLIEYMFTIRPYICLQEAIRALLKLHLNLTSTVNQKVFYGELTAIWNTHCDQMEDIPNEYQYFKDILSSIKEEFKDTPSIGKKLLRTSIIRNCLNLYIAY